MLVYYLCWFSWIPIFCVTGTYCTQLHLPLHMLSWHRPVFSGVLLLSGLYGRENRFLFVTWSAFFIILWSTFRICISLFQIKPSCFPNYTPLNCRDASDAVSFLSPCGATLSQHLEELMPQVRPGLTFPVVARISFNCSIHSLEFREIGSFSAHNLNRDKSMVGLSSP